MRKLVGIAAVAACLSLVGTSEAKAAGPYYVYFKEYCDCMTLYRGVLDGHQWYFGTWDWECTGGVSSTLIHGAVHEGELVLGTHPIDSTGAPAGLSVTIGLESTQIGSSHSHGTATSDGVTNFEILDEADYYLRLSPPCPGPPNTKPRIIP